MSCTNDPTNPCGCASDDACCNSVTELEQLVNDAVEVKETELEQLAAKAKDSADNAHTSEVNADKSAQEAKGYRDSAETAASSATGSLKVITDTAVILEDSGKMIQHAAEEVLNAIAGIAVRNWFYTTTTPNQTVINVPTSTNALGVQAIYIEGSRQDLGYGYEFDRTTMQVTLAEPIEEVGTVLNLILGVYNVDPADSFPNTLAGHNGATLVGMTDGKTVQQAIDSLVATVGADGDNKNTREIWRRMCQEIGLGLHDGSFQKGATLTLATDTLWDVGNGKVYVWHGALPKTVPANSTPLTTGGIDASNWEDIGQRSFLGLITSNQGATRVGYQLSLPDAISRILADKLKELVSVVDFGADPTGATMSTTAIQKALDSCSNKVGTSGHGYRLYFPAGRYKVDGELLYTWRASDANATDADINRVTLIGDGDGLTFIDDVRSAPGAKPLLTIDGGTADPHLRLSLHGIRFQRPGYDRLGWGLKLQNISITDIVNCTVNWFGTAVVVRDCIQIKIDHSQIGANAMGLDAGRDTWTNPNVFDLRHVMFSANNAGAVSISNGTNFKFDTCTFEGNGSDMATHNTIHYDGGSDEGGMAMIVSNCYFENNQVLADINIGGSDTKKNSFIIEGNSMQRTSPTRYAKTHILFNQLNPAGKHRAFLRANTFKFLGGYTHQTGDSSVTVRSAATEIREEGNIYQPQQLPEYVTTVADGYNNKIVCTAKVSVGATPTLGAHYNASSVTRTATGMYKITFQKEVDSGLIVPVATAENVTGNAHIYGYDTSSVTVYTTDPAGTASDVVPFNVIAVGIML